MKALIVVALVVLAGCHSPLAPEKLSSGPCTQESDFSWMPITDAAGDTVLWYGACIYRH